MSLLVTIIHISKPITPERINNNTVAILLAELNLFLRLFQLNPKSLFTISHKSNKFHSMASLTQIHDGSLMKRLV
jgi:hypothetical protein